jgi:hypothetical protein
LRINSMQTSERGAAVRGENEGRRKLPGPSHSGPEALPYARWT